MTLTGRYMDVVPLQCNVHSICRDLDNGPLDGAYDSSISSSYFGEVRRAFGFTRGQA